MSDYFPIDDPVLIFAIVAALILLSPILLGRFRLPGMIGLLLAGAILGPNALGVLARDQSFVLFGTVGLLYILFMAALEIDLAVLKRYRVHSMVFGVTTFALPQTLGFLVTYYLLGFELPAAILLASLFASHTLLAYPIASRLGISKTQAVTTAVGGTILTDTWSLLVLAVVAASTRGQIDEAFWYRLGISIAIYVLAILIGLPRLGRWFFRKAARDGVSEFVFVLAAVFGCASLSRLAGVQPIVGAFLAGLALNRLIPHSSTLMSRIRFTGEAVFVPFFLLSVGMLLDVRVFAGGLRSWYVALGMVGTVIITKFLAAESTRLFLRYGRDEARVVFGLTVAQAAATLAATMVGYEIGLFDDAVVNGAILMILGTCILAPLVVDKYGHILAAKQESDESAGPPQRILVALAKPLSAPPLLELAQLVRDPAQGQPVYPLSVVGEGPRTADQVAQAEKMLSKAVLQLSAADVPASPVTRIDLNIPSGILRARRELRGTEVIIGWAGRSSTAEFFFGSVLEQLLADPHYTLMVSRLLEPLNTCHRVLLAIPPSADQERSFPAAIRLVKQLTRQLGASLIVLSVKSHEQRVKKRIQAAKPAVEFTQHPLESWSGVMQALADAVSDTDLIVLHGLRGGTSAWRSAPGDLPERLARRFPDTNLLVVYPAEPQEEASAIADAEIASADEVETLALEHVVMNLSADSLQDTVRRLLPQVPALASGAYDDALVHTLVDGAVELTPGVVLLHAETELVRRPAVILGVSKDGIGQATEESRAYVCVVLIDPPGRDATRHLKNLAAVARMFHSPEVIERARTAADADELLALFDRQPQLTPVRMPAIGRVPSGGTPGDDHPS
jgi:Kef-type K+ transport system membrane component KefB/mannitol/fructose-specific phosphotransferase system IIA component (Ntr-type)